MFLTYFQPKASIKYYRNRDKFIYDIKKPKKSSKKLKLTQAQIFFHEL